MSDLQVFHALLRSDLSVFIQKTFTTVSPSIAYHDNWHIDAIAWQLTRVMRGEIKRLIITMPPRSLKSISASVAFPAWLLGLNPAYKIICVSYAQELAAKHSLDTRSVMESDWYRECFSGTRLHPDKNAQSEFMTTQRGMRLATSVGGSLTGRGGKLIIIDDPHKADEVLSESRRKTAIDFYRNTLVSRLDNKQDDAIILIQQRLHQEDLAGYLLESGDWTHLNLPAFAENDESIPVGPKKCHQRKTGEVLHQGWESKATLEHLKKELGSYAFAAQYQQRPVPVDGGMVKWPWFKSYDKAPDAKSDGLIVQSWDTANKAEERHDWSVCTTWLIKDKRYYLLHVYRVRLEFPALKRKILAQALEWGARTLLIEDKAAGTQLIQDLVSDKSGLNIISIMPTQDKQTRMMTMTPPIEAGRVHIPTEAHWLAEFRSELMYFPNGKHDDQIDSLSQFLEWAENHCRKKIFFEDFHFSGSSIVDNEFPLNSASKPPWEI